MSLLLRWPICDEVLEGSRSKKLRKNSERERGKIVIKIVPL